MKRFILIVVVFSAITGQSILAHKVTNSERDCQVAKIEALRAVPRELNALAYCVSEEDLLTKK